MLIIIFKLIKTDYSIEGMNIRFTSFTAYVSHRDYHTNQHYTHKHLQMKYKGDSITFFILPLVQ